MFHSPAAASNFNSRWDIACFVTLEAIAFPPRRPTAGRISSRPILWFAFSLAAGNVIGAGNDPQRQQLAA